jgi:hypothetical protein
VLNLVDHKEEQARYVGAVIVFHFTFTITETNKLEAGADFALPVSHGTFTLGIGGGTEKERSGERDFTVTDTFAETLEEIYQVSEVKGHNGRLAKTFKDRKECAREATGPNFAYPITGKIGLDETIRTFVELNRLHLLDANGVEYPFPVAQKQPIPSPAASPLSRFAINQYAGKAKGPAQPKAKSAKGDEKAEAYSDELEFTTTIKANASPKVELKPVGSGFRFTGADATLSGQRVDKHKVIVTLTLKKPNESEQQTKARAVGAANVKVERGLTRELVQALRKL